MYLYKHKYKLNVIAKVLPSMQILQLVCICIKGTILIWLWADRIRRMLPIKTGCVVTADLTLQLFVSQDQWVPATQLDDKQFDRKLRQRCALSPNKKLAVALSGLLKQLFFSFLFVLGYQQKKIAIVLLLLNIN